LNGFLTRPQTSYRSHLSSFHSVPFSMFISYLFCMLTESFLEKWASRTSFPPVSLLSFFFIFSLFYPKMSEIFPLPVFFSGSAIPGPRFTDSPDSHARPCPLFFSYEHSRTNPFPFDSTSPWRFPARALLPKPFPSAFVSPAPPPPFSPTRSFSRFPLSTLVRAGWLSLFNDSVIPCRIAL